MPTDAERIDEVVEMMRTKSVMFSHVKRETLRPLAAKFKVEHFTRNEAMIKQGDKQERMFLMRDGDFERIRVDNSTKGAPKVVEQFGRAKTHQSVGSLHFLRCDPAYSTLRCRSDHCVAYTLRSDEFRKAIASDPVLSEGIVYSLQREVRSLSKRLKRTPLTLQKAAPGNPILAVSIAAGIESFYRSALNAYINAHLTGQPRAALFPDMHRQIPARVLYINGTKGIRQFLDNHVDTADYSHPELVGFGLMCAPGVSMTPVSSYLEASNAGHRNPKSMWTRWMDGISARMVREIIFAAGLNQATDWFEERVPSQVESPQLRNLCASLTAGVLSGYFSHVPHNLSALKLMEPSKGYWDHFKQYASANEERMPAKWSPESKTIGARILAIVMPKAVMTRTIQIVGTFCLLNGGIYFMRDLKLPSVPGFT